MSSAPVVRARSTDDRSWLAASDGCRLERSEASAAALRTRRRPVGLALPADKTDLRRAARSARAAFVAALAPGARERLEAAVVTRLIAEVAGRRSTAHATVAGDALGPNRGHAASTGTSPGHGPDPGVAGIAVITPRLVAGYAAMRHEVDLRGFPGSLAYPRRGDRGLTFHRCPRDRLAPGAGGIAEPSAADPVEPDVVLVPLLAVDAAGNRLGQGGGHYDRALAALRARRRVVAVGIAWDVQVVAALPVDPWDQPLDAVATPTRWWRPRA